MNKAVAIALFALGLFGIALFVTALQMGRLERAADTVDAIRDSQHTNFGSSYRGWPGSGK